MRGAPWNRWKGDNEVRKPSGSVDTLHVMCQLPVHLTDLANAVNPEDCGRSVRMIKDSLEIVSLFPFERFYEFQTHEHLLQLVKAPLTEKDMANVMDILCRWYLGDTEGRKLLVELEFGSFLLETLMSGCSRICAGAVFAGLAPMIAESEVFKAEFIARGCIEQLGKMYDDLGADAPSKDVFALIRSVVSEPLRDEWIEQAFGFIPLSIRFIESDSDNAVWAFEVLDMFVKTRRDVRCRLVDYGVARIIQKVLGSDVNTTSMSCFCSALAFAVTFSADGQYIGDMLPDNMVESTGRHVREMMACATEASVVQQTLADFGSLILHDPEQTSCLFQSDLFRFMAEKVLARSPYLIARAAATLLCTIMRRYSNALILLYNDPVFFGVIDSLLENENPATVLLSLEVFNAAVDHVIGTGDSSWLTSVANYASLLTSLRELSFDSSSERIAILSNALSEKLHLY